MYRLLPLRDCGRQDRRRCPEQIAGMPIECWCNIWIYGNGQSRCCCTLAGSRCKGIHGGDRIALPLRAPDSVDAMSEVVGRAGAASPEQMSGYSGKVGVTRRIND